MIFTEARSQLDSGFPKLCFCENSGKVKFFLALFVQNADFFRESTEFLTKS